MPRMIDQHAFGAVTRVSLVRRPALMALLLALGLPLLGLGAFLASAETPTPAATEACPAGTPASGADSAADCVVVGMYDIYFKPNLVTIPSDTGVRVVLENHGVIEHNFSVTDHDNSGLKDLNIVVDVAPGQTGEATIDAPEGEYYFFCNEPGHEAAGMRGYITVKKDATIDTAEATVTPRAG
jgi:uncharacterized cupredoxin-like copper-binding protein